MVATDEIPARINTPRGAPLIAVVLAPGIRDGFDAGVDADIPPGLHLPDERIMLAGSSEAYESVVAVFGLLAPIALDTGASAIAS